MEIILIASCIIYLLSGLINWFLIKNHYKYSFNRLQIKHILFVLSPVLNTIYLLMFSYIVGLNKLRKYENKITKWFFFIKNEINKIKAILISFEDLLGGKFDISDINACQTKDDIINLIDKQQDHIEGMLSDCNSQLNKLRVKILNL